MRLILFAVLLASCSSKEPYDPPPSTDCADDPGICDENATCTQLGSLGVCTCNEWYRGDGITCTGPISCADDPCFAGVICTDLAVGYSCGPCPTGYDGDGIDCVAVGDDCAVEPGLCSPTALPVDYDIDPISHGHANYARLDPTHLVVAYAQETDRSSPSSEYHIRIITFDGTTVTAGAVNTFSATLNAANNDQAMRLVGRLDANHFILVVQDDTWGHVLHFFERSGDVVSLLDSIPQDGGYFGGHPVDDGRYLLRYRQTTWSNSQVKYRIVRLNGSAMVLEPELDQLPPSDFPGLDPGEPQTFSPVARIGPTTFREIRAGYVYDPGYLGAWTITVNPDHTLTASAPQVFDTSEIKSMGPLVATNGTGEAVVLYQSYDVGWFWGGLTAGLTSFAPGGTVVDTSGNYGFHSWETSHGYINGRYYLRSQVGNLLRFDTVSTAPAEEASGLEWSYCYCTPSVVRMGNFGVFLVCDGTNPLHLRFLPL